MKGFTAYAQTTVTLTRGDESIAFVLSPLPFGYQDVIAAVMPQPKPPLGADKVSDLVLSTWINRRGMLFLARCLGPAIEAPAPAAKAGPAAWEAYADAILAEFQSAHLVEGDLQKLLDAMSALNRGAGELPKA